MNRGITSKTGQLVFVVAFAVIGAASLWYWGSPSGDHVQRAVEAKKAREFKEQVVLEPGPEAQEAMAYVEAAIDCDCDGIIDRTEWMRARLDRLNESGASPDDIAADRASLCEDFCERDESGYEVVDEGVDDPYLFFPGVEYKFIGQDEGRDDLAVPVASRAWIALRFPSPTRCLKNPDGRAISGVTVGLNMTAEGLVAKAGVLGNTEIQWDSVRYSW